MRLLVPPILVILSLSAAVAASRVEMDDLASVSPQRLEGLRDTEFEVFLAQVALVAGKLRLSESRRGLDAAKRGLPAEELDRKAAVAEHKAARAHDDSRRLTAAERTLDDAERDRATAALLVRWREQELKASRLAVERAGFRLELAEARRDLARARAMHAEQVPAAAKHSVAAYEKNAIRAQTSYEAAMARLDRAATEAERLARAWEQRSESAPGP